MDDSTPPARWTAQLETLFEDPSQVPEDRQFMLQGLLAMQRGDVHEATSCFRRAQRKDAPPFSTLAALALGECLRLSGKEGAALKAWRTIAEDDEASPSSRYGAWLGIATTLEARGESPELKHARAQLRHLDTLLPGL